MKYYYGACLYPELWDQDIFIEDVKHMKQIGMNFTRIGEFVWSMIEPVEGVYDFKILTDSLDILSENKMDVVLCIPTPTPPRWMTFGHEERLTKTISGDLLEHGSRQHICTNNYYFREKAHQLAGEIAKLAEKYSNVIAIQLDNEFKAHTDMCVCDTCKKEWSKWLEKEYQNIDNLNQAWGTKIWSEEYPSFESVVTPVATPFLHNTSLVNAYRRFTQEKMTEFVKEQVLAIREYSKLPITHNSAHGFNIDNHAIFSELDFASFDTYASSSNYDAYTLNLDFWRNITNNPNFMLMETSASHGGHYENYGVPHPKGYLLNEIFLNFATGGMTFNFWHFRGHVYGSEQPHSGVITSWGEPDVGYSDVVKGGKMLTEIRPLLENSQFIKSQVGLVYSDRGKLFINIETGGKLNYRHLITTYYSSILSTGTSVEVIPEQADFSDYKVLIIPYVHYVDSQLFTKIKDFIETGGTCILGPITGDRTKEHTWHTKNGLGELGEYLKMTQVTQSSIDGKKIRGQAYGETEILEGFSHFFNMNDAEIVGQALDDFAEDKTFISKKTIGQGQVFYVGSLPAELRESLIWKKFIEQTVKQVIGDTEIQYSEGVVGYRRQATNGKVHYWLANMTDRNQKIIISKQAKIVFSTTERTEAELAPYECRVYEL